MPLDKSNTAHETLDAARPEDSERWAALVAESPASDVYYMPTYAEASSEIEHSDPLAVVAGSVHCRFLAPLTVRKLSAVVNGSEVNWTDACSPYGYGGLLPLSSCRPTSHDLRRFLQELHDWCRIRSVTCCALRLHPILGQDEWFMHQEERLVKFCLRGQTTAIDLTHWDDVHDRPAGLRKDRRWDLNRACRLLRVTWATGDDHDVESQIDRFIALYGPAMEQRQADSFYRFPRAYFSRLASLGRHFGIAFAWLENQLAGASIFLGGRDYGHYHLAAANELGLKYGAATLLIVEGARWARMQGCKLLHLGGGLKSGDSLEHFKFSLGSRLYRYAYVVSSGNPELFEQIRRIPNAPWPYAG